MPKAIYIHTVLCNCLHSYNLGKDDNDIWGNAMRNNGQKVPIPLLKCDSFVLVKVLDTLKITIKSKISNVAYAQLKFMKDDDLSSICK